MKTFLATPVRHQGEPLGNIYLTEKEGGREFNLKDEDVATKVHLSRFHSPALTSETGSN